MKINVIGRIYEAIIAIIISILCVGCVVAWLGIGSGLIDPFRLFSSEPPHRVLTVK